MEDRNNKLPERQQEKSQVLTDSLYDGPLDHIIRNHPELFMNPLRWTNRHAGFLHVACKEEPSFSLPHHHRPIKKRKRESSIRDTDEPRAESNMLGVPHFQFPKITQSHLESNIGGLKARGADDTSNTSRLTTMDGLLDEKMVLDPNRDVSQSFKNCKYESDNSNNNKNHRLTVKRIPIVITYADRRITIVSDSQTYTSSRDTPYALRHAWRLIYLDRSQLQKRHLSKQEGELQRGVECAATSKNHPGKWAFNAGRMAGLFIAMAQQRQNDIEHKEDEEQRAEQSQDSSHVMQLQPRYQILLTDRNSGNPCIYLYTAQVSDFLLEHFRTPARLPPTSRSEPDDSHLMKIHRVMIPAAPLKSARRRLRVAIIQYANGTAGGFFADPSPQHEEGSEPAALKAEPGE
ncbi:hypothetical protein F4823DRAFT_229238 [Ustulina deusta]|nr:hypothetical protein F4823DRAFT_229238 [Ustulina deusta]